MPDPDSIDAYDFTLPPELVARHPADRRDGARLLILPRDGSPLRHARFPDLVGLLRQGDLLVMNDTFVLPARLEGVRVATGGRWSGLSVGVDEAGRMQLLAKTKGRPEPNELIAVSRGADSRRLRLLERRREDDRVVWLAEPVAGTATDLLDAVGWPPLPPYILQARRQDAGGDRDEDAVLRELARDFERYQTVYAQRGPGRGSVAAPTAGLHFTPELLSRLAAAGVQTARVQLHVGEGTFRPVTASRLDDHTMHAEWFDVPEATREAIAAARARGGRVLAVGTTTVRALEADAAGDRGQTSLFIRPGFRFRVVDGLVTNFHMPRSTLLVMIAALVGRDRVLDAYAAAIAERYRFYSFGDAMLIA